MKIAVVQDYLERRGGAERVVKTILEIFPEADVFTLIYDKEKMEGFIQAKNISVSVLNKLPRFIRKRKKYLIPIMPTIIETFNLRDYDVVISSSGAFSKGIVTKPRTVHICYCHSPMRFAWDWQLEYKKEQKKGFVTNFAISLITNYLRLWDFSSSRRVDYFIANSQNVADRIKKYYSRDSKVIYPPVDLIGKMDADCEENIAEKKDYFLIISNLTPYKKIDLAVEAFNKLELPLIIAGEGSEYKHLQKIAKPNIKFLGFVSEEYKKRLLRECSALIFSGEDDFGITIVEALSAGKPVLALRKGGALEILKEGETGEFFDDLAPEVLAEGVKRLRENMAKYDADKIRESAEKFSKERFKREFKEYVEGIINKFKI